MCVCVCVCACMCACFVKGEGLCVCVLCVCVGGGGGIVCVFVVVVVSVVVKGPAFPACAVVGHSRNPHNYYYQPLGFLESNDRQGSSMCTTILMREVHTKARQAVMRQDNT